MTIVAFEMVHEMDDREARILVEQLIQLRRASRTNESSCLDAAETTMFICAELVRGMAGWAGDALKLRLPPEELAASPAMKRRTLAADALERGLAPMDPLLRAELAAALQALNAGSVHPLVERNVGRRGAYREISAQAQLNLLRWVRWQHGLGRTITDAESEAANAIGRSREAIEKWQNELKKVFGDEAVSSALVLAEQVGRLEARGESAGRFSLNASDHEYRLREASGTLVRNLRLLAETLRQVVESNL